MSSHVKRIKQQTRNTSRRKPRGSRSETKIPGSTSLPLTVTYLGKNNRAFPPIYRTKLRTVIGAASGTVNTYSLTFKANSLTLTGPRVDFAGAFANNVASDLAYLLSTNASGSSFAPYGYYRVLDSTIKATIVNAASVVANVMLIPTLSLDMSAMSSTQFREQERVSWLTTAAGPYIKPQHLRRHVSIPEMLGIPNLTAFRGSDRVEGSVAAEPLDLVYFTLAARSFDGTSTFNLVFEIEQEVVVEFYGLNNAASGAPSVSIIPGGLPPSSTLVSPTKEDYVTVEIPKCLYNQHFGSHNTTQTSTSSK